MGFFDTLRHVLSGEHRRPVDRGQGEGPEIGRDPEPGGPGPTDEADATAPAPDTYDRLNWQKKLKRILNELPGSQPGWPDLMAEARALGFDPVWVYHGQVEEFRMMVRRAVSDRHFTEEEHRRIDLARDLIGIPEAEAEAILHAIVAEAEAFFGAPVEES